MNRYLSDFKLPKVHFRPDSNSPEQPPTQRSGQVQSGYNTKLKLISKYRETSSKSRGRSRSDLALPLISHQQHAKSRRKQSSMIMIDMNKKKELDEQKKLLQSIKHNQSQKYRQYRQKYYRREKIKQALDKIHSHKLNADEIGSNALKQRCLNVVKNSIFYDPLLQFYRQVIDPEIVLDAIFHIHPVDYDLAREVLIVEQKLNNLILAHKNSQIECVSKSICEYSQNIKQLRSRLLLFAGDKTIQEVHNLGNGLETGEVKGLIRGFRLEQENMRDRINRQQKYLGKLITNRLLLTQAQIITKKQELLRDRSLIIQK